MTLTISVPLSMATLHIFWKKVKALHPAYKFIAIDTDINKFLTYINTNTIFKNATNLIKIQHATKYISNFSIFKLTFCKNIHWG